jgi:MoxR-like ATPase
METFLLGKRRPLEYALTCLLARGHLLIEDVPGVGKTTLAKCMAFSINGQFKRIQFTSDLLPSDLIGVTVFLQKSGEFQFQQGPVFTNVLLADEINRANPKTQSALLEAMHDMQVSHDGKTMALPDPFFVVATQNSKDNYGTFPLPESQLDRFLMRIHLGYPSEAFEKKVIKGDYNQDFQMSERIGIDTLKHLQEEAGRIHVSGEITDYLYSIIQQTRNHPNVKVGVSPRGGQALYRAIQSLAFIRGRSYVIPDDIRELAHPVLGHRLILKHHQVPGIAAESAVSTLFDELLANIPQPV